MDALLIKRAKAIDEQIKKLEQAEKEYFYLDAHKDVLFSQLFMKKDGSSIKENEALVHCDEEYQVFLKSLAEAHAKYNKERRNFELKIKLYDGEYLSLKTYGQASTRQP